MTETKYRRPLMIAALAIFAFLVYLILRPFAVALAWSVVLTLALQPPYQRLRRRWPRAAPYLMTLLLAVGIAIPVWFVGLFMAEEAIGLAGEAARAVEQGRLRQLAERAAQVPGVGRYLAGILEEFEHDPAALQSFAAEHGALLLGTARSLLVAVVKTLFHFAVCIFAAYFLFRHGDALGRQLRGALLRLGGPRMESLLGHVRVTVRAVVYGVVMTAIAQGMLAAVGFWFTGVPYPLLLGALTVIFSFIPFGPPFIWLPSAIALYAKGATARAVILFLWGLCVVSTIDNVLRPLFIGQATKMPVLLVFIGVLGGLAAFGMLGLFVGPVIVAVALAVWRDWIAPSEPTESP